MFAAKRTASHGLAAKVALVWDYEAKWLFEIHPQGADFHYPRFAFEYYARCAASGSTWISCRWTRRWTATSMIVVPPLPVVPDGVCRQARCKWRASGARTAHRVEDGNVDDSREPATRATAPETDAIRVWRVESMRPNVTEKVGQRGKARHWRDFIETGNGVQIEATSRTVIPPSYVMVPFHYLASLFDETLTQDIFAGRGEISRTSTPRRSPEGIRISRRGSSDLRLQLQRDAIQDSSSCELS